jgi:hypothetical protein
MSAHRERYADIVLDLVPKLLSSFDKDKNSKTFGCFDKAYWLYKTSDFPCARLQEPVLTLALLYSNNFKSNRYFKNERVREYVIAGLRFLSDIQNSDGSFNEWYPNEHSFCGTVFPTYSASEAYRALGLDDKKILNMLNRAGRWILKNSDDVSNQEAGAIAALQSLYKTTGNRTFERGAVERLRKLASRQSEEGWFPEYDGADIGYLTVLLDFLGKYYIDCGNRDVIKLVDSCLGFLKYFIHPDGTLGGTYGSRNTDIVLAHGFEIFSGLSGDARFIAETIYKNIDRNMYVSKMDDRYMFIYHISYLQAFLHADSVQEEKEYTEPEPVKLFKNSGLFTHRKNGYYFVSNLKKGGVFRVFKENGEHLFDDSGIVCGLGNDTLTTQWNDSSEYEINGNTIKISGRFIRLYPVQRLSPMRNIALRTALVTIGNTSHSMLKRMFRKRLIREVKKTNLYFERVIELKNDGIVIRDEIKNPNDLDIKNIHFTSGFVASYVPTAHFFQSNDILPGSDRVIELKEFPVKRIVSV